MSWEEKEHKERRDEGGRISLREYLPLDKLRNCKIGVKHKGTGGEKH